MPNKSRPLRVLVVDDEPLICWALAKERLWERPDAGRGGQRKGGDSRAHERAETMDVVLLDYKLPDSHDLGLLVEGRTAGATDSSDSDERALHS